MTKRTLLIEAGSLVSNGRDPYHRLEKSTEIEVHNPRSYQGTYSADDENGQLMIMVKGKARLKSDADESSTR